MEQGLHDWLDGVWPALEVPPPAEVPHIIPVKALFSERAVIRLEADQRALEQFFRSDEILSLLYLLRCRRSTLLSSLCMPLDHFRRLALCTHHDIL